MWMYSVENSKLRMFILTLTPQAPLSCHNIVNQNELSNSYLCLTFVMFHTNPMTQWLSHCCKYDRYNRQLTWWTSLKSYSFNRWVVYILLCSFCYNFCTKYTTTVCTENTSRADLPWSLILPLLKRPVVVHCLAKVFDCEQPLVFYFELLTMGLVML